MVHWWTTLTPGALRPWFLLAPVAMGVLASTRRPGTALAGAVVLAVFGAGALTLSLHGAPLWEGAYSTLALWLGAVALAVSPHYLAAMRRHHAWPARRMSAYYALLGLFVASLVGLAQPWPLVDLWVAVEATTLTSVALVALSPGPLPFEAAWKYVSMAVFAGLLALAGVLLLDRGTAGLASAAAVLLLVGFGAKAGLVPFHMWLPDAHAEAPAPVSALLSGAELAGILMVLHRALNQASLIMGSAWPNRVLIGLGLLSLALGVALIPRQSHLKRLFAYSSVEHMGVVAVGLGLGGLGAAGAFLHVFTHGVAKAEAFYLSGHIQGHYGTAELPLLGALARRLPWTSGGLLVAVAALAGLPPLGPFWSEWLVIAAGMRAPIGAWVGLAVALLLALGMLGLAYRMPRLWAGPMPGAGTAARAAEPPTYVASMVALTVLTAGTGLLVPWLYHIK
jgi:hydrogenase-4 component F